MRPRAFPRESRGPRAGDAPRPGGVTNLSIQSLFFVDRVHMLGDPVSLSG